MALNYCSGTSDLLCLYERHLTFLGLFFYLQSNTVSFLLQQDVVMKNKTEPRLYYKLMRREQCQLTVSEVWTEPTDSSLLSVRAQLHPVHDSVLLVYAGVPSY